MEFVIPQNNKSTVYNFLKKGTWCSSFWVFCKNLDKQKKIMEKKGYIYVGSFTTNVSCFGGEIKTMFFYKNNFFMNYFLMLKK